MFDAIADRYDLVNRVMSLNMDSAWRRRAVAALELREDDRVLDLATGTADLALALAATHPSVHVVGLDPSSKMLAVGERKVQERGLAQRIQLIEGDAQDLPFADASFDGLCMAFGIRNVPDRAMALREMVRVVRPHRRIAILELSEPTDGWLGGPARWYVHSVVPFIGALLSGAPQYRYLQRSIAAFPRASAFAELMRSAGLEVLRIERLGFGACHLYVAQPKGSAS